MTRCHKRVSFADTRFPISGTEFTTFCLFVRVYVTGRVELNAIIRKPYSSRPKTGGGIAVPFKAVNP